MNELQKKAEEASSDLIKVPWGRCTIVAIVVQSGGNGDVVVVVGGCLW